MILVTCNVDFLWKVELSYFNWFQWKAKNFYKF